MTPNNGHDDFNERLDRITARHEALAQSVELLAGSTHDLKAIAEAGLARQRERQERDSQFLAMMAVVLKQWADGEDASV